MTGSNMDALKKKLGRRPMIEVPRLDTEVNDLEGLARMNEYLFTPSGGTGG